jgi:hypothetical protein
MKCNTLSTLSLVVGLSLTSAFTASASSVLNPGDFIGNPGTITVGTGGTTVASVSGTFSASTASSEFSGTYNVTVYSDPSNVYCAGCYDFIINLTSDLGSTDNIEKVSDGSFDMTQVTVGYSQPGVLTPCATSTSLDCYKAPNTVARTTDGADVSFGFKGSGNIAQTQSSATLVIETSGMFYAPGSLAIQDDVTSNSVGFGDVGAPEPITMGLLGGGLAALGLMRWRRKSRKD